MAQDVYKAESAVRGRYCSYGGFICSFKEVVAYDDGSGPRELPTTYKTVEDFKPGKEGEPGRCWITTKTDTRSLGWFSYFFDWWNEAPSFYGRKEGGGFEKLGAPEYVVFRCRKI